MRKKKLWKLRFFKGGARLLKKQSSRTRRAILAIWSRPT